MNTDNLDTLTDSELNELFAVEVAGLKKHGEGVDGRGWYHSPPPMRAISPVGAFTTDANAVLPWLEKELSFNIDRTHLADDDQLYRVSLRKNRDGIGLGPTLARAAVIALLRAKRASK